MSNLRARALRLPPGMPDTRLLKRLERITLQAMCYLATTAMTRRRPCCWALQEARDLDQLAACQKLTRSETLPGRFWISHERSSGSPARTRVLSFGTILTIRTRVSCGLESESLQG